MITRVQKTTVIAVSIFIFLACTAAWLIENEYISFGRQSCLYENFTDTVRVTQVLWRNDPKDTLQQVDLTSVSGSKHRYFINSWDLRERENDIQISLADIKDSTSQFVLSGERITQGTCSPNFIAKARLLK